MNQPHIIFIFPDQMRRDSLGSEGGPVPTPRMDRLAREGTSFARAYCNYPMCTPSRATLFTGRPAASLRDDCGRPYLANDRQLDPTETTYAHVLNAAGYCCSYFGKWHNAADRGPIPPGPLRLGFDGAFHSFQVAAPRLAPLDYDDDGQPVPSSASWTPFHETDCAIKVLESRHRSGPQMLALAYSPPHEPYDELPPELHHLFEEARTHLARAPLPANVPAELAEEAREMRALYYAQVMGIDCAIGRLLDALDRLGIADNTLVVLSSDHGDQLLSHGLRSKNQCYDASLRVPLVFHWPGRIAAGRRIEHPVSLVDLAPTLVDFGMAPIPGRMIGRSLKPVLLDGSDPTDRVVTAAIDHPWFDWFHGQGFQGRRRCIVTRRYKLVVRENGTGAAEPDQFFDLENDPDECVNLARDPASIPEITRLGKALVLELARTGDRFLESMLHGLPESGIEGVKRKI